MNTKSSQTSIHLTRMVSNRETFAISLRKSKRSHIIQAKRIKYEHNLTKVNFLKFLNSEICSNKQTGELLLKFQKSILMNFCDQEAIFTIQDVIVFLQEL